MNKTKEIFSLFLSEDKNTIRQIYLAPSYSSDEKYIISTNGEKLIFLKRTQSNIQLESEIGLIGVRDNSLNIEKGIETPTGKKCINKNMVVKFNNKYFNIEYFLLLDKVQKMTNEKIYYILNNNVLGQKFVIGDFNIIIMEMLVSDEYKKELINDNLLFCCCLDMTTNT